MQTTTLQTPGTDRKVRFAMAAAMALLGLTLLGTFAIGSYLIPGRGVVGMQGWPQPIGWIVQLFVIESFPTYDTLEIRWLVWTLGTAALLALAAVTAGRAKAPPEATLLQAGLAGYCAVLAGLVAALAASSLVPELGWSWTWQLAAALLWMLAIYWWALRLPLMAPLKAVALSMVALTAVSLLYSLQGSQRYPNWPIGNVLLLTTACLAGIFLLGTWAYGLFIEGLRTARRSASIGGLVVTLLLVMLAIAVSLAGRRAGVLGLLAGAAFMLLVVTVRSRRAAIVALVVALLAAAAGAVLVPRLFHSGRWETVLVRAALYTNTIAAIEQNPLVGIGPGQLGGYLTSAMRPLHAESPRLFHGEVSAHAHSEPLHVVAEVGLPVGLLYLVLPLGGLVGYVVAYRRGREPAEALAALGLGAALSAVMAAEATSVGMRHPGVAALLWALVAIGYAAGVRNGAYRAILRQLNRIEAGPGWQAPWLRVVPPLLAVVLCILAAVSVAGGYHLNNGLKAWNANRHLEADAEFDRAILPQDADHWLMREYLRGRSNLTLARQASNPQEASDRQAKALADLTALADFSPGFKDTLVWQGRALADVKQLAALCQTLCDAIDPYDREGLLVLASLADNAPARLEYLRASLRNEEVIAPLARMIAAAAKDPAGQQTLASWLDKAQACLAEPDPSRWADPLALETCRLAVIVHGENGDLAQAAAHADRAATLCGYTQKDVRHRRREAVELEVYLDQAWFGWLARPEAQRSLQAMLARQVDDAIYGEAENYSGRMALQALAIFQLAEGKRNEAMRSLLASEGAAAQVKVISQLTGLAYARLAGLARQPAGMDSQPVTTRPVPDEANDSVAEWTQQGKHLLGERKWAMAVDLAGKHRNDPWWRGVLTPE